MAVVSQIWVQHLQCGQIIGHCHLRVGSELEPELGGALYTALSIALEEIENTQHCCISGVYGFQVPEIEGIGLFTTQNKHFRIYFLCEGLYSGGIPFLGQKKLFMQIEKLFEKMKYVISDDICRTGHLIKGDHFWFDILSSLGIRGQIILDEIEKVYPLQLLRINLLENGVNEDRILKTLEAIKLGSLGHGWKDIEKVISTKVEGIFSNPIYSFKIYQTLFHQFKEYLPGFKPDTVILTYNDNFQNEVALLAFLSICESELNIRFCLPVSSGLTIKGDQTIFSSLQSFFLSQH
ncbi:MAG: hypothetical protein ACFE95_19130 [Candidatus Hodarchaeota archaeon]